MSTPDAPGVGVLGDVDPELLAELALVGLPVRGLLAGDPFDRPVPRAARHYSGLDDLVEDARGPLRAVVLPAAGPLADRLPDLLAAGVPVLPSTGAVLAIPVGGEVETFTAWRAVFDAGVYTNAAVYPGVARGCGVLRLSVMATHTDDQLHRAATGVAAGLRASGASAPTGLPAPRTQPVDTALRR